MISNSSLALGGDRGFGMGGIGQADFNSISTRNMNAVNATVEGGITSGQTWNTDGTIRNANALGGIFSRSGTNEAVRLNGLVATGRVDLGGLLQGQNSPHHSEGVWFHRQRRIVNNSFLFSSVLSSGFNRDVLWNWLNARYSNIALGNTHHPIIGTMRITAPPVQGAQARTINITHLGRLNTTEYRLFGMGTDGIRYSIWIPNTGTDMILINRGNNTGVDGGTNVGPFAGGTADLAQV